MSTAPAYPAVEMRDLSFDFADSDILNWHRQGPHVGLFFSAMSPFFPEGEKFFIRSVRHFEDQISDETLRRDVKGFIGQEAMHGREHRAYNAALDAAGLPADKVQDFVIRDLAFTEKNFSPKAKLAMTIALEHWTAIMAAVVLRDARVLDSPDPAITQLWRWHAVEETEHKAVAFDVYKQVAPGWGGYWLRVRMMLMCTFFFWLRTFIVHSVFCRRAGVQWDVRGWVRCWWFLWGRPGTLRRIVIPWLSYFRPGFHPWDDDARAEVERWKAAQSPS